MFLGVLSNSKVKWTTKTLVGDLKLVGTGGFEPPIS